MIILFLETYRNKSDKEEKGLLFFLLFTTPVCTFLISYFYRPIFVARGFLVCSMFLFGLVGWMTSKNIKKLNGWIPVAILVINACLGLSYQIPFNQFPRSPFDEADQYLLQRIKPDDVIIHDNKLSFFPAHYYSPNLPQTFIQDEAGSSNDTYASATQQVMGLIPQKDIQTTVGNRNRVYFITFSETLNEYQQMAKNDPSLDWLQKNYRMVNQINFNDLEIYYFIKSD